MAEEHSLRYYIDLVEAAERSRPWGVSRSSIFDESMTRNMRIFPKLDEKLVAFLEVKLNDPLTTRYGKHDRPFTGPLVGFWHAHLRDDAIIIYNLVNRCINLVCVVSHMEIDGKRAQKMAKKIAPFSGRK